MLIALDTLSKDIPGGQVEIQSVAARPLEDWYAAYGATRTYVFKLLPRVEKSNSSCGFSPEPALVVVVTVMAVRAMKAVAAM